MIDVYILYSGELNYLDFQIALLRKWVGAENIFVVQGPFGSNTIRATEMQEFGAFEGVRTILVPPDKSFVVPKFKKIERIYTYLMQELLVRKPKRTSLILHGDMLPVEQFDIPQILNGKYLAGCGSPGHRLCPNLTWMLIENRVLSFNKTPLDYPDIMLYDTEVLTHQFLYYFKDSLYKEYSKTPMFYCQPGFVHLDHVSSDSSDVLEKKTQLLEENFLWLVERTT